MPDVRGDGKTGRAKRHRNARHHRQTPEDGDEAPEVPDGKAPMRSRRRASALETASGASEQRTRFDERHYMRDSRAKQEPPQIQIKKTVARGLSINGKTPRNMITDDQATRPKNERPPTHTFKNALVAVQRRRNIGKHEAGGAQKEQPKT